MYDPKEQGVLATVKALTAHWDRGKRFLGVERQDDVAACHSQEENPGYRGDDVSDPHGLKDVSS